MRTSAGENEVFELWLPKRELKPNLLLFVGASLAAGVGFALREQPQWLQLGCAAAVFLVATWFVVRVAAARVEVDKSSVVIHPAGRLMRPVRLEYREIRETGVILNGRILVIVRKDGAVTEVGPFQAWNVLSGPRRLAFLAETISRRVSEEKSQGSGAPITGRKT